MPFLLEKHNIRHNQLKSHLILLSSLFINKPMLIQRAYFVGKKGHIVYGNCVVLTIKTNLFNKGLERSPGIDPKKTL